MPLLIFPKQCYTLLAMTVPPKSDRVYRDCVIVEVEIPGTHLSVTSGHAIGIRTCTPNCTKMAASRGTIYIVSQFRFQLATHFTTKLQYKWL